MFVPPAFRVDDPWATRAVIQANPMAVLVNNGPELPYATHLPAIIDPVCLDGPLEGATILGHMNRANPQWTSLVDGARAKLVFTGPNGYVSPVLYGTSSAAPTWDFIVVHAIGRVHPFTEFDDTLRVVRHTVAALEPAFGADWDDAQAIGHFRRIGRGVGAFRFVVESVESMFKLSQEQKPDIQDRVMASFRERGNPAVADWMGSLGLGSSASSEGVCEVASTAQFPVSLWGGQADPPALLASLTDMARSRPDAVAVVDGERSLTYGELYGWVAEIAETLTGHGVAVADRVAVTGRRGAEVVAAFLATLTVGATYVPLDPEYPVRRLTHMVTDSEAKVLLFTGDDPAFDCPAPLVPIPAWRGRVGVADLDVKATPDLPMYVIYTSGSTGWPKGVAIPHACLAGMAQWQRDHSPRPDLRTAQFAPLNFDVFFQEVLGTLCGGGTLVVMPERLRREPFGLLEWAADNGVERLFLPNMALQMFAVAATVEDSLEHLRLVEVNTAGEQLVCTPQLRELFDRMPGCRLVNHYGQSESAMVTSHILTGPSAQWPALPPIGVPLPGCEVLVDPVDADDPTVGELLVAGLPLSLGYLGMPELTEARYIDMAPSPQGNTRAFRTGDLVRVADGVVQFLTRVDDEVKIRGIRVNLLEIDAWLVDQPGVTAAVAVVVETASGARTLRAAATADRPLDTAAMLGQLAEVLPEVAVPASITVLPELPRSPSGKIDRARVAKELAG